MPPKKRAEQVQAAAPRNSGDNKKTSSSQVSKSRSSKSRSKASPYPVVGGGGPTTSTASRSARRKHVADDDHAGEHIRKKTKIASTRAAPQRSRSPLAAKPLPTINQAPTQVLAVFPFGNGDAGELGLGPAVQEAGRPCLNPFLDPESPRAFRVVQLDCGGMHTIALTQDNKILTWGVNDNGALGRDCNWDGGLRDIDGDSEEEGELNPLESTPTPVPAHHFPSGIEFVQVAAGDSCSLALTDTGLVYGWGTFKNSEGKEMFGSDNDGKVIEKQLEPTQIRGLEKITQITCGANHALALDVNGVIWAWGCGEQNQLGRRLLGRRLMDSFKPHRIEIKAVKYIASGEYHSFAVDEKDNVWAWGLNSFGEAGYAKAAGSDEVLAPHPMKIRGLCGKGVVCLDGGAHHSAAVTADGQCLVWGRLDGGQLGIAFSPEQLRDSSLIRYDERDKPRICLRPTSVPGMGQVRFVACGTDHTIFVTEEGAAYATGFNSQGQLGLGGDEDDVEVARRIKGKAVRDVVLTWAGAGGQFSAVAAPSTKPASE